MAAMHSCHLEGFRVVHPLDAAPEPKCESEGLGPLAMTPSVRLSLMALRVYLVLMSGLLLWRVIEMAGFIRGR
jgi:hypothetical protein